MKKIVCTFVYMDIYQYTKSRIDEDFKNVKGLSV